MAITLIYAHYAPHEYNKTNWPMKDNGDIDNDAIADSERARLESRPMTAAAVADCVVALALIVIGIVGLCSSALSMPRAASWVMIGAGVVNGTAFAIVRFLQEVMIDVNQTECVYNPPDGGIRAREYAQERQSQHVQRQLADGIFRGGLRGAVSGVHTLDGVVHRLSATSKTAAGGRPQGRVATSREEETLQRRMSLYPEVARSQMERRRYSF